MQELYELVSFLLLLSFIWLFNDVTVWNWFNMLVENIIWMIIVITLRPVIKLKLSWVERNQLNSSLSSSWDWVDFFQLKLNSKLSWVDSNSIFDTKYSILCTKNSILFLNFFPNFFAINFAINLVGNMMRNMMRTWWEIW